VIEMRKDDPGLLSHDTKMVGIFTDLDELQDARDRYVKEKDGIKQRRESKVKRYGVILEPEAT
jgi:hypothetical protein